MLKHQVSKNITHPNHFWWGRSTRTRTHLCGKIKSETRRICTWMWQRSIRTSHMYVYDDGQIFSFFRAKTPKVNVCEGRDKGGILARGCIKQMRDDNLMLCDWSFEWPLSIVHPGVLRGVCFHWRFAPLSLPRNTKQKQILNVKKNQGIYFGRAWTLRKWAFKSHPLQILCLLLWCSKFRDTYFQPIFTSMRCYIRPPINIWIVRLFFATDASFVPHK